MLIPQIHKPRRERIATYSFKEPFKSPPMVLFSDVHLYGKLNKAISVPPENVRELFKLLQKYTDDGYELYGLGDILEGWRSNAKQILKYHPEYIDFLVKHVHIIRGNHDWTAWRRIEKKFGIKTEESIQIGPIYLSHGHKADPINRTAVWYSRYATKTAGLLKRAGINTDIIFRKMRGRSTPRLKALYRKHSLKLQTTIVPTASIFCYGHLHIPYIDTTLPETVVVNLGSIANHVRIFSYVEITQTELILWKITL